MNLDPGMLLGLFIAVLYILVAVRVVKNRFVRVKKVRAEVVGRQTVEQFSKYGKRHKYAVTFLVDGKKKSFYVSEFSYGGYRKGEKGTLTYQGERLIDFQ